MEHCFHANGEADGEPRTSSSQPTDSAELQPGPDPHGQIGISVPDCNARSDTEVKPDSKGLTRAKMRAGVCIKQVVAITIGFQAVTRISLVTSVSPSFSLVSGTLIKSLHLYPLHNEHPRRISPAAVCNSNSSSSLESRPSLSRHQPPRRPLYKSGNTARLHPAALPAVRPAASTADPLAAVAAAAAAPVVLPVD